jgi:hypothetical protein
MVDALTGIGLPPIRVRESRGTWARKDEYPAFPRPAAVGKGPISCQGRRGPGVSGYVGLERAKAPLPAVCGQLLLQTAIGAIGLSTKFHFACPPKWVPNRLVS